MADNIVTKRTTG